MKTIKLDQAIAIVFLIVGAGYLWMALDLKPPIMRQAIGPEVFPIAIAIAMMGCGVWLFVEALRDNSPPATLEPVDPDRVSLMAAFGALLAYALLLGTLGFIVTTAIFLLGTIAVLETSREHWPRTVLVSVVASVVIFLVFDSLLGVTLPAAPMM